MFVDEQVIRYNLEAPLIEDIQTVSISHTGLRSSRGFHLNHVKIQVPNLIMHRELQGNYNNNNNQNVPNYKEYKLTCDRYDQSVFIVYLLVLIYMYYFV